MGLLSSGSQGCLPAPQTGAAEGMQNGSQVLSSPANVFDAFLFHWWSSNQQLQHLCQGLLGMGSQPFYFLYPQRNKDQVIPEI